MVGVSISKSATDQLPVWLVKSFDSDFGTNITNAKI